MSNRTVLDHDLLVIRDDILRLGALVDQQLDRAFKALRQGDKEAAQAIVSDDTLLDDLHNKVEEQVTKTFALQQPMARDLRKLIADLLISNELERMGDHAESIARGVTRHPSDTPPSLPPQLPRMKERVSRMINQSMDAYVDMDTEKARAVALLDDEVDEQYQSLLSMLVTSMSKGKISVEEGTFLLWVGHNLERIGDRTTNISERIVYAQYGEIEDFNPKPDERR